MRVRHAGNVARIAETTGGCFVRLGQHRNGVLPHVRRGQRELKPVRKGRCEPSARYAIRVQRSNRDEFRVVISGVELSDADRDRINMAVQQAALSAIADLDFGGDRAAFVLPISPKFPDRLPDWWGNPGQTQGIWIGPMLTEEIKCLLR